jgi:hypothetical protein
LAASLKRLNDEPHVRRSLSKRAIATAGRYTAERMLAGTLRAYHAAIQSHRGTVMQTAVT